VKCRTILIIEDEEAIRDALVFALEIEGYRVSTAANGEEGLAFLRNAPAPCLIVLDLMMPVMNGWEFVESIRKDIHLAVIPIVVMTAFASHAKAIPAQGIVEKPVDLPVLLQFVGLYCGGERGSAA
jgi:CheY-like chemotaxis protein